MFVQQKKTRSSALILAACIVGAAANAEVVFKDSFESGGLDSRQGGAYWRSAISTKVTADKASDGDYAARVTFRGNADLRRDSNAYMKFHLADKLSDVWMRYDLYVPDNYVQRLPSDSRHENKGFVTLWGGHSSNPFSRSSLRSGVSFWPNARSDQSTAAAGDSYATVSYSKEGRSRAHRGHSEKATVIDAGRDTGKWMSVFVNVKAAQGSASDGRIAVWQCETPCEFSSLNADNATVWQDGLDNSHSSVNGFDRGYLFGWAATGFSENTSLYIDNVVIADSEADLVSGDAVEAVAEAAPSTPRLRFGDWTN